MSCRRSVQTPAWSNFQRRHALSACCWWLGHAAASAQPPTDAAGTLRHFGSIPLQFEANAGQANPEVKFLSRGRGYTVFLTPTEAVLSLRRSEVPDNTPPSPEARTSRPHSGRLETRPLRTALLRLTLLEANPEPSVEALDKLAGTVNHFLGHDPGAWRAGVPTYAKVRYGRVYPGVDLVYYGNQRRLEYDFLLDPGADPGRIALQFAGADKLEINAGGELLVTVAGEKLRWERPVAYQEEGGTRRTVAADYVLRGSNQMAFRLGRYDATKPLVIDPVLGYATYLGGNALDRGAAIAVDHSGQVYVTGQTVSPNFVTTNGAQPVSAGQSDAFITKLNSNGTAIVYSTYFGGSGVDYGAAIAVDAAGSAYVAGSTTSTNLPLRNAYQSVSGGFGKRDAFLVKLGPFGTNLLYSSYLGGTNHDDAMGLAVDNNGQAYVTGSTISGGTFPRKNPFQPASGGSGDAFVTKFNPTLAGAASLVYSSPLGGPDDEQGNGIAVDAGGNACVAGDVFSLDFATAAFPVANALQAVYGGGGSDGFVAKIGVGGTNVVFSTYLGGTNEDTAAAIAVDAAGNLHIAGGTISTNFPVVNAAQPSLSAGVSGNADAFVAKLHGTGTALLYSTYLGGELDDTARGIAVGGNGLVHITGETKSESFPVTPGAFQTTNAGGFQDAFVAVLNPALNGVSSLRFSTYFGGSGGEEVAGIAVDANGHCYITGQSTSSADLPITPDTVQPTFRGGYSDAFIAQIMADPRLAIAQDGTNILLSWPVQPSGFGLQALAHLSTTNWTTPALSPAVSNGLNRVTIPDPSGNSFFRLRKP